MSEPTSLKTLREKLAEDAVRTQRQIVDANIHALEGQYREHLRSMTRSFDQLASSSIASVLPSIDLSPLIQRLGSTTALTDAIYEFAGRQAMLSDQVQRVLSSAAANLVPQFANLSAVSSAFDALSSSDAFVRLRERMELDEDTVDAFKQSGWPIPPSMSLEFRRHLCSMHRTGKTRHMSRSIIFYYHQNEHRALKATVRSWEDNLLFAPRVHIFNDALDAHVSGKYTLSVPALIPQIEGILIEYVTENGIQVRISKIGDIYEAAIGDPMDYDLATWVIASTLLFQLQSSTYAYTDFRKEIERSASTRTLTRHTILHGVSTRYDRPINSLKAFLALDAISALSKYS